MIELVVDNREREIIARLSQKGVVHTVKTLDIGDFLYKQTDSDTPVLIIERKSVPDLKASIVDGRAREQKARMLNTGISRDRILYLVEGNLNKDLTEIVSSMPVGNYIGSIINTMFRDGLKVYKTSSITETVEFLTKILSKLEKDGPDYFKYVSEMSDTKYSSTLSKKKKENMTPNVWFITLLSQIPQISETTASVITQEYKSMSDLCLCYEACENQTEREKMLENLSYTISSGAKRKIGPVISSRVYKFIYGLEE